LPGLQLLPQGDAVAAEDDPDELHRYFEEQMPNNSVASFFEEAQRLNLSFVVGYAELDHQKGIRRRFNSAVLEPIRERVE